MSNKNTYSQHYISSGMKNGFYTLRHQYSIEVQIMVQGIVTLQTFDYDQFIRTLATDADRALTKATEMGYKVNRPQFSLEEIKKRKDGLAKAEQEAYLAKQEEESLKRQKQREELIKERVAIIKTGVWPFGKYEDEKLEEAPNKYIMFMGNNADPVAEAIQAHFPHLFLKENKEYFGEVKQKYTGIKVLCIESFSFEGAYGWTSKTTMLTEEGNRLVYWGDSFIMDEGNQLTINFKVKKHSEYQGKLDTAIFYIKETK